MKALFKLAEGPGNMEVRDAPRPKPGKDEVLIEVKATGVCGSDIHIYHGDIGIPLNTPVITGHEFAGVIAAVGSAVTQWQVGERVTSETAVITCETCGYCRTGRYNLCPGRRVLGYWVNGAFAPYTVVPAWRVHRLSETTSFRVGAMTEPLACCVHAVNELTTIHGGDTVAVIGPGPIGSMCMQLAALEGARVVMVGTSADKERLTLAEELGAEATADTEAGARELVDRLTDGSGVDAVFECAGAAPAAALGLELVRRGGSYTQVGLFGGPITIDFERIAFKELKTTGSIGSTWTAWDKALRFVAAGQVQLQPLIGSVYPLRDWQQAFRQFEQKEGMKIMIECDSADAE